MSLKHPEIYVKYDFIYVIKIPADSKKKQFPDDMIYTPRKQGL